MLTWDLTDAAEWRRQFTELELMGDALLAAAKHGHRVAEPDWAPGEYA